MADNHKQHSEESEIIDLEEFARAGKSVPPGKRYRIRVDKDNFEVESAELTGAQILALVNKTADKYNLYQHIRGGQTKGIGPNDPVNLTEPGVERFTTMKIENTEGQQ
jgi:hypothetical protein